MKKTEKLNIGGLAFNVEEDAAAELKTYLDTVKNAYREDASCDEICSDIEERIGELLAERTSSERIVTISAVDCVKSVMGDFLSEEDGKSGEQVNAAPVKKRFYRSLESRFLGGVFSGLSIYTDVDVVLYRLIYSAICIVAIVLDNDWSGTVLGAMVITYLAMWICVPAARTVEQKCQLAGKPISINDFKVSQDNGTAYPSETQTAPAFKTLGRILLICLGVWLIISGSACLIGCGCVDLIRNIINSAVDDAEAMSIMGTMFSSRVLVSLIVSVALFSVWKIYAGVLLTFNLKAPKWRPGLILISAFLVSALIFLFFVVRAALTIPEFYL